MVHALMLVMMESNLLSWRGKICLLICPTFSPTHSIGIPRTSFLPPASNYQLTCSSKDVLTIRECLKEVDSFLASHKVASLPAFFPPNEDNSEGSIHRRNLISFFENSAKTPDEQWLRDHRLTKDTMNEFLESLYDRMR